MGDKASPTTELLDTSYETIILVFDLVGKQVPNIPDRLLEALQGVAVKKEIENFLTDYYKQLLAANSQSKVLSSTDAGKMALKSLEKEGKQVGKQVLQDIAEHVKGTKEFEQLKDELHQLGQEFKDQPIGVWFTDTKAYIIATGVLISGAAIAFATYSGVKAVGLPKVLSALQGKPVKMKAFGSVDLAAQIVKYDKLKGIVDYKFTATKDWKPLKVGIEVVGHASAKDLVRMEGMGAHATLSVQATKNVMLEAKAGLDKPLFDHHPLVADLEALIKIKPDQDQPFSVNIGASVKATNGKQVEKAVTLNLEFQYGSEGSPYSRLVDKGLAR